MKIKIQVAPVILSNIENKQIPITSSTPPPLPRPYSKKDDTKLRQTLKTDTSEEFYTSYTDIRQLNENDAEIKRLKQENEFLNKILKTFFPEKIHKEELQFVNYVTEPLIPSTPPTTNKYPEYVKEPIILDLHKKKLSKFVELDLPQTQLILQTPPRVQEKKREDSMEENLDPFS